MIIIKTKENKVYFFSFRRINPISNIKILKKGVTIRAKIPYLSIVMWYGIWNTCRKKLIRMLMTKIAIPNFKTLLISLEKSSSLKEFIVLGFPKLFLY